MRHRDDRGGPTIGDDLRANTSAPLDSGEHYGLALPVVGLRVPALRGTPAAVGLARPSTDERLVHLDLARKRRFILRHQFVAVLLNIRHAVL